jgi:putative zinc ribbon protein
MIEKRYPRDRRPGIGRRKGGPAAQAPNRKFVRDALYGEIPLIRENTKGRDGKLYEWWRYDPSYQPPLPRGAVRGDVGKQVFCVAHHTPKYFYLDEGRTCSQCGKSFTFRASEQKYWYETLKFNFSSVPIRCVGCRRQRRSEHALREQIAKAKADVRAASRDPAAHLALARAIVEYHERTSGGKLDEAIAAARMAAALWPDCPEPLFWEGAAQARAGRKRKARQCLQAFLSADQRRPAALAQRAKEYLENETEGT